MVRCLVSVNIAALSYCRIPFMNGGDYCNFICSCVSCLTSLINYEQVIYI